MSLARSPLRNMGQSLAKHQPPNSWAVLRQKSEEEASEPKPMAQISDSRHHHQLLLKTNPYAKLGLGDGWCCEVCRHDGSDSNAPVYHCAECQYDLCVDCSETCSEDALAQADDDSTCTTEKKQLRDARHPHALQLTSHPYRELGLGDGWCCEECGYDGSDNDAPVYHCAECKYDICLRCVTVKPTQLLSSPMAMRLQARKHGHKRKRLSGLAAFEAAMRTVERLPCPSNLLTKLLLRPGALDLPQLAARLPVSAYSSFAGDLLQLARSFGQAHFLVADCISHDIDNARHAAEVLRTDTLFVRTAAQYISEIGKEWVQNVLQPVLPGILAAGTGDQYLAFSLEIDTHRLTCDSPLADNQERLQKALLLIIDAIESNVDSMPTEIKFVLHAVHTAVSSKFSGSAAPLAGSLLFLRLVCPAITNPASVAIRLAAHTESTQQQQRGRRKLVLLAKWIQTIANGDESREIETSFDGFLVRQMARVSKMIHKVASKSPSSAWQGSSGKWVVPSELGVLMDPLVDCLLTHKQCFWDGQDSLCRAVQGLAEDQFPCATQRNPTWKTSAGVIR